MPRIIDYEQVLDRLTGEGKVCNYFNGGAFGFPKGQAVHLLAWIGPPDSTIRPQVLAMTRQVPEPFEQNLAAGAIKAWQELLPSEAWVMPMSHWAFELDFANAAWMPEAIRQLGLDPAILKPRPNAAAIAFARDEHPALQTFLRTLLQNLSSSDFMLAFPGQPVLCSIHHHKQLWWVSPEPELVARLDALTPNGNPVRLSKGWNL